MKRKRNSVWSRIAGEISKLRQRVSTWSLRVGSGPVYTLDSSRVDYKMARSLYENNNDNYKLGAGFARPIINTAVGFMGVPRFRSEDEMAQEILDEFFGENVSLQQETHRGALVDGDAYVWVTREENTNPDLYPELGSKPRLVYNNLPPEQVQQVVRDPLTGEPIEYVLASIHEWEDERGNKQKAKLVQRITADKHTIEVVDGPVPPGLDLEDHDPTNKWGFIPIVHFPNERRAGAAFGRSDLEPVEPFLKAYHDVFLHGIQGSKLHSTPKLRLTVKQVERFLKNNFGVSDPAEFIQRGGKLTLEGRDLILLEDGESAEYVEVQSATGSTGELLKFLFYCIVDVSETPEFSFGTHTPSSHASVKEQMPVLIRRIARKREYFANPWQELARIVLAMHSKATGVKFETHATALVWDLITERDEKEAAETLESVVNALARAVDAGLMSDESAVNFLAMYVETMSEWQGDDPEVPGEREKIIRTKVLRARLDDAELSDKEQEVIAKILEELDAKEDAA